MESMVVDDEHLVVPTQHSLLVPLGEERTVHFDHVIPVALPGIDVVPEESMPESLVHAMDGEGSTAHAGM